MAGVDIHKFFRQFNGSLDPVQLLEFELKKFRLNPVQFLKKSKVFCCMNNRSINCLINMKAGLGLGFINS